MTTEELMNAFKELKEWVNNHSSYCSTAQMKALKIDDEKTERYFHGCNTAYHNVYNAIDALLRNEKLSK